MEPATYIAHLRRDGAALSSAARGNLEATVPSCPEWSVGDLVWHTGHVYLHKVAVMGAGGTEKPEVEFKDDPEDDGKLIGWYENALNELIATLEERDPEDECWTFFGPKRLGFWHRRMAQEAAVHRWDAEVAAGDPQPIDSELATDGIDEMLNVMVPADEIPYEGPPGTIHLHRTDGDGEWLVTLDPGKVPATRSGHEKGDAALRGTASDLLLLVWRRLSPKDVEVFGDQALIDGFYTYLAGPGL